MTSGNRTSLHGDWRGRGFTLIELLTVICILSMMVALLAPALKAARGKARSIACVSNLRQIGLAVASYANDYDGWFPCVEGSPWYVTVDPYWTGLLDNLGYVQNGGVLVCPDYPPRKFNDKGLWWVIHTRTYGFIYQAPVQLKQIANPSATAWITDSVGLPGQEQSYFVLPWYSGGWLVHAHRRHAGRANVLFADGHVAPCDAAVLQTMNITYSYEGP